MQNFVSHSVWIKYIGVHLDCFTFEVIADDVRRASA